MKIHKTDDLIQNDEHWSCMDGLEKRRGVLGEEGGRCTPPSPHLQTTRVKMMKDDGSYCKMIKTIKTSAMKIV